MIRVASDYVYHKNWTIKVRPKVIQPFITMYNQFNEQITTAVLVHSKVGVMCVVKDTEPRKLTLSYAA